MTSAKAILAPTLSLQRLHGQVWLIHAFGGGLVAVAAATAYLGYLSPQAHEIDVRQHRMAQLEALMASREQIAEEHTRLEDRLGALKKQAATIARRIPLESPTQEFIERATQLAALHDVKMELCSASAPHSYPTHSQAEVTCRFSGSFASICRYLAAIDQLSQVSRVSRLEISSSQDSRSYPVQAVFQLYYRAELHDTEGKRGNP
ncbi:MAG: hypothetical protein DCC67_02410 [Planctomycetota bacterium]|nr:MAG: hypothetical protein DCC67_02410 [Planctomycetota bacterium]